MKSGIFWDMIKSNARLLDQFTRPLLDWYETHGRKNLPWQSPRAPYPVWISEIMLQQTQVKTVIPYFTRFMDAFPDIACLATATEDDVLSYWSGLGYYSRARNIHKTAQIIYHEYNGIFPQEPSDLIQLPGIGESTAAAIASLVFNKPTAILDGNVKRVLCRFFAIQGEPNQTLIKKKLWQLAFECMHKTRCADYTQAIMDLGATCCTLKNPACAVCPVKNHCKAFKEKSVISYPHKKATKKIPTKNQQFLLLYTTDQLFYLEKRPAKGLWGSLWGMPCIDKEANPVVSIYNDYGLTVEKQTSILTMKHTFSHFHLNIKAIALRVTRSNKMSQSDLPGRWYKAHELDQLGLAKPVRDILDTFLESCNVIA